MYKRVQNGRIDASDSGNYGKVDFMFLMRADFETDSSMTWTCTTYIDMSLLRGR